VKEYATVKANSLDGKVALITGGASGIGLGTAVLFAGEGAGVAIVDVPDEDAPKALAEVRAAGGRGERSAIFLSCNVSDPEQVRAAVEQTVRHFGRLDIAVANAGINGVWAPLDQLEADEWDRTLAVNLRGTFLTMKYAIPHLKSAGGGSLIVMGSVNGNRTFSTTGASAYTASKAGQVALAKQAALELGRWNIRVNAICPGQINTNIAQSTQKRNLEQIAINVEFPGGNPALNQGRGEPDDVARVCLFLASDLSRHVSGVEIYVDGGFSLIR
jgi:NAD(P)-dependent dehydrogenase (short-subunit alcohol dehydrogenase family)